MDEVRVVAAQLEREPRAAVEVLSRCHLGLPVVIAVPPLLDDGTPFPTSYWLTCPLAVKRIGRIEADGGVRAAKERLESDASFDASYEAAMDRYRLERDARIRADYTGPRPTGGVGGSSGGVKCLHAHYADHVAGREAASHDNPIGAWVAPDVEPLNCIDPCVAEIDGAVVRNPTWVELPRSAVL